MQKIHRVIKPKYITFTFYLIMAVFLAAYLKSINFNHFKEADLVWGYVFVASLIGLVSRTWQTYIWMSILSGLGANEVFAQWRKFLYVYAKSWLGRYIPGTAPWLLGKIYFASKHGVSRNKLAVSSLLEGGLQITVVLTLSLIMLLSDTRLDVIDVKLKIFMLVTMVICIVSMTPPAFNRIVSILYRLIRKNSLDPKHFVNNKTVSIGAFYYAIGAIMSGLSLFFIAKAIYPDLPYTNTMFVMGVGNLAGAVSMLAVFAPSGIGVREGIQLSLLSLIMPTELALLVTITTRLWGVVMDFVFFGLAKSINAMS